MQTKTIKKVISNKLTQWLTTISDEKLRNEVRENILVSGGSITSLFLNQPVNDYDVYIMDMDVLIKLAQYYCPGKVLDGRLRDSYLEKFPLDTDEGDEYLSEEKVRHETLKENQVKFAFCKLKKALK